MLSGFSNTRLIELKDNQFLIKSDSRMDTEQIKLIFLSWVRGALILA